jgi:cytochrome c-type biogenesis protein CcmH
MGLRSGVGRSGARGARALPLLLALLALLVIPALAPAAGAVAEAAAPGGVDSAAREIARSLRCPVCEGLSVADSPTALAAEMRALIRKKVAAGESSEEIVAYFVERYGEEVALVPRRQGLGLALWWGPVAIFLLGGVVVARALWGGRRQGPPGPGHAGAEAGDGAGVGEGAGGR